MLSFLNRREMGENDPMVFYRAETTRRVFNMQLSDNKDVEKLFTGSINTLDLDLIEKRYLLAGGADGFIVIYDMQSKPGQEKHTYTNVGKVALNNRHRHKFSVETVNWYPTDTGIFTSSGTDCLLKIWDTNRLKPADEYQFSGLVYNHHMSPIASMHCLIAVAAKSSSVKLVDLKSGSATHSLKGHRSSVFAVKWSPHNEFMLATGGLDCNMFLWDIRNAKGSLLQFDEYNGKPPKNNIKLNGTTSHGSCVNGIKFSSDGLYLISCANDNQVHLWDTFTGKNTGVDYGRVVNRQKRTVQFSVSDMCNPNLLFMPNESNKTVDAFNMTSGNREFSLRGHYSYVNCCLFNEDYHELYTAGNDRNILVWTPDKKIRGKYTIDDSVLKRSRKRKFTETEANKGGMSMSQTENVTATESVSEPKAVISVTADTWSSDEET